MHTVTYIVGASGVTAQFSCDNPEDACHFICPEGCESVLPNITAGSGTDLVEAVDQNGHRLERRRNVCNFVEWMEADDDPFESYEGADRYAEAGPIAVHWNGDHYSWAVHTAVPHSHSWRLAEDGYTRTWSVQDADGDEVTEGTDFLDAYDGRFALEGGDGDYHLECSLCLHRVPYVGEVNWT